MNTNVINENAINATMERIEKIASTFSDVEQKYPITVSEFRAIQQKQFDTFVKKLNDYGPYNVTLGREIKDNKSMLTALSVIAIRCTEKTQRLINLLFDKHSKTANEPVIDSFDDISIYGIIAQIISNNKWGR